MSAPLVSVIMPLYNAAPYVGEAVRSILDQSLPDLELIVVDDGSTDGSADVVRGFTDARLTLLQQPNKGVAHALNAALGRSKGRFISRQDADDVSLPDRLRKEVDHFNTHPDVVIVGAWSRIMTSTGEPVRIQRQPLTDAAIRFALLFDTPFVSTSVMFRAEAALATGGFDPSPAVHDDYDMWSRLCMQGKAANLPEVLVLYRVLTTGLTHTMDHFLDRTFRQRRHNAQWLLPEMPEALMPVYLHLGIDHPRATALQLKELYGALRIFIDRTAIDQSERSQLQKDLHRILMSARMLSHRTLAHRLIDKLWKRSVLHTFAQAHRS